MHCIPVIREGKERSQVRIRKPENFLVIKNCLKSSGSPSKRRTRQTTGLDFTQSVVCFSSLMALVEGEPKDSLFTSLVLLIFSVFSARNYLLKKMRLRGKYFASLSWRLADTSGQPRLSLSVKETYRCISRL